MVQFTELLRHFLKCVVNCSLGFLRRNRDRKADCHFVSQRRYIHDRAGNIWSKVENGIDYWDYSAKSVVVNMILYLSASMPLL